MSRQLLITELAPNEVLVYGSNSTGFSGAGLAGLAVRGTATNTWRTDPWVAAARAAPVGHPDRIGKWAVWGVARGWSKGMEGMGYAVQTIERPGLKRSTPLADIRAQLVELWAFCRRHPEWHFLLTPIGAGLAGWSEDEMAETLLASLGGDIAAAPANLIIPVDLYGWNWSIP